MEELLKRLGIDETADAGEIVRKLELKQSEIMERLDNVEDEKRKQKLEYDLKQIGAAIAAFSWMKGKMPAGIAEEDADAQYTLGFRYLMGKEVDRDPAKAVECWRKAAEQGHAGAQLNLGTSYADGEGVAQDYVKAVEWLQKAAEQGNAGAQFSLGNMYRSGKGVARDDAKAVEWYQKAAEQGNAGAQHKLRALGVSC